MLPSTERRVQASAALLAVTLLASCTTVVSDRNGRPLADAPSLEVASFGSRPTGLLYSDRDPAAFVPPDELQLQGTSARAQMRARLGVADAHEIPVHTSRGHRAARQGDTTAMRREYAR